MTTTPNLGLTLLQTGQLQPEVTINNDLNILDTFGGGFAQFGNNTNTTGGLTYGYYGGRIYSNGLNIAIANGTIGLTASATNYVQRTAAGIVSVNTTGYTTGLIPMATVVTGTASITTVTDTRPAASDLRGAQSIAVAATNITLTDAQVNCRILRFTGTLTANVVVTLPSYQQEWVMSNETTGAFTVQVQTASGSPIAIDQGVAEKVYGNGSTLKSSESRLLQESDLFGDFIASGIIGAPVTGLAMTLPAGVAYILGQRTTPAAYAHTYPASSDCYVDLSPAGVYTVVAVANGVAEPSVTAGSVRVQVVVTSATDVTGVTQRLRSIPHISKGSELGGPFSNSSTNIRIGTLSISIDMTSSFCEIFAKCIIQKTGTYANAALYVARDGAQIGEMAEIIDLADTQFHAFIAAFLDAPGPGTHVYEFWWGVDAGSTDTLSTVSATDPRFTRSLSVKEVFI